MAIIYSYPITTPQDSDLFIISRVPDDPDEISNFSVGVGTIAEYIIDKLIDPNAFDFQIPVFNQSGNRITGSIMSQDSSPSNGVAGTKITIAGNTTTTGDVQIDTLTNNYIPVNNNQGVLRDSGFYQVDAPVTADKAVGLNTANLQSVFGEFPDLRVASRSFNDPGVLDLFRPDGDVQAGDRVGILQYSVNDDAQYAVAQIEVKTLGQAGTGNSGGGKLCIKTSKNQSGAQPTERLCIDDTEADFSVPINVTNVNRSSFAGQVTIPLTPIQNTDAASKGYVDSQLDKDLQIEGDTGTGSINLDTQVFDVAGGTYIDTVAGGQTITVDISAVDGNPGVNERYLTKNNTWAEVATIPGTYRFNVNADTGTAQTVNTTETLLLAGGTYINTSVGIGPEVTFNHDSTTLTNTSSVISPGAGGSFNAIDSITTNLQGHVTEINTLTVTLPQDTDNYVDGGSYSSATGVLTLSRTGGLANVTASGFLQIGTTSATALAGDTTTITQTQADDIIANNAKVSFPEAPSDGSQYARQNGGWSVVSGGGGGGGTVTSVAATHGGNAFTASIGNVSTVNPSVDITLNGSASQYIDGAGNLTTFPTITTGTVESVGLSMPAAFLVANSPVTTSGTLTVTGVGTTSEYIDGTGALQTFPTIPPSIVGGSGTVNTIPIWSTTTDLGDSQITQDNTGADPIFDFNSITGTNQYTPPTNTVLYKLKSGDENKFSITQDGGGGVVLPSGDILNNGPSFNMGGNAFANGENALSVGAATTAFGNGSFAANFLTLASGGGASAFGLLTEATALASAAFGNKSQSTGNYSIAAGQDSIASGQSSVAIGEKGDAQGKNTFVSGFGGIAIGNNAVKFGYEGSADGNNSAKFGFESVASGPNSLATGTGTTASGSQSIATGDNNVVSGNNSFIGGKNSTVTASSSILYGQGSSVGSDTSAAFGQSNTITVNSASSFVAGDSNNTSSNAQVKLIGSNLIASTQFGVYLGRLNDNTDTFNRFQIGNGTADGPGFRSNALSINSAGHIKLPTYGSGTVTGTATRNLSVDADGKIIETAVGGNTNYSVQVLTANATGQKNYLYVLQGTSAIELTLPASPSSGDSIKVSNLTAVTTCTINPGSERIMSIPQIMTLDNNKAAFELIYVGPAYGWVIVGATGEI